MLNSKLRHLKIIFILFVFIISILTVLSACANEESKKPQQEQPQENYYTVTYLAEEGGAIDGIAEQSVKEGENAEAVTAVHDDGYYFVKWSDGVTTATRQDINVTSEIIVTAEFEKLTYTVQYLAGEGGTIIGNVNQQVKFRENAEEVTAVPDEGYYFVKWSDGATTATRQDTNVASEITVTAEFEKITYTVRYLAGEGGTISGNANQQVKYSESATTVSAMPDTGYKFVKWSDGVTERRRQDLITSAITVTAEFEKITYTVQYLAGEGGTIRGNTNQQVKYTENAEEVTAVPDEGYYFVKWSDGVITATRQETNVTSEITVTAEFEKITYTVQYLAGEGGAITGNVKQQVKYGESAEEVTAVPNDGYKFIGWSDGVTTATRQDTNVTSEITVTAEFKLKEFAGGIGTQSDPYLIENYEQFKDVYKYPTAHYKLISDLDLSGIIYEPYFTDIYRFEGTFDGNGRTVKNLAVNLDSNFPSLFGFIGVGGIVKNLNIENADLTAINFNTIQHNAQYCIGILAGVSFGTQVNVNVSGTIHGDTFQYDQITIGGLIGMAYGDTVNCNSDVNILVLGIERLNNTGTTMPYVFGGLVGVYDSLGTKLNGCFAKGSLTVSVIQSNASVFAGGLVGYYFTERNSNSTISDCQTDMLINGNQMIRAGGFIGDLEVASNSEMQISNCSAHGAITAALVGGFIYYGDSYGELQIEQCFSDNDITGDHQVAGFIYQLRGEENKCFLLNCYSSCSLNANSSVDPENVVGQAWGFGYQLSHINITNCYASGNISGRFGGGFIWSINNCVVQNSYSDGIISLAASAGSGIFAYYILNSIIENCYSRSDIFNFTTQTDFTLEIIKFLRSSKLNRFYYAGNSNGNIVGIIYNSEITNVHVLENSRQESDLIGEDRGEISSTVDITLYKTREEMYLLSDKLNKGLEEDIWVDIENDLPQLKSMI